MPIPTNVNEALAALQGVAVETSKGVYVPLDKVKELFGGPAPEPQQDQPKPKTMEEAREAAKASDFFKDFPKATPGLGRAVVANQPAPPAAVEGVKA